MTNQRSPRDLIETAQGKEVEAATIRTEGTEEAAEATPLGITSAPLPPDTDTDTVTSIRGETMTIRKGSALIIMFTYFVVEGTETRTALNPKRETHPPPVTIHRKESRRSKGMIRERLKTLSNQ
ncbi:MAG: hypothetical protein ACMG6E_10800 [Candidatus Roizmanbacteria bacterium]